MNDRFQIRSLHDDAFLFFRRKNKHNHTKKYEFVFDSLKMQPPIFVYSKEYFHFDRKLKMRNTYQFKIKNYKFDSLKPFDVK